MNTSKTIYIYIAIRIFLWKFYLPYCVWFINILKSTLKIWIVYLCLLILSFVKKEKHDIRVGESRISFYNLYFNAILYIFLYHFSYFGVSHKLDLSGLIRFFTYYFFFLSIIDQVLMNILSTRGVLEQGACLDAFIAIMLDSSSNQMVGLIHYVIAKMVGKICFVNYCICILLSMLSYFMMDIRGLHHWWLSLDYMPGLWGMQRHRGSCYAY